MALVSIVVVMVKQLPTRGSLANKAHLPADTELLIKLVRPVPTPTTQHHLAASGNRQHAAMHAQPRSMDELREVRHTLELYRQNYSVQVAVLLITAYLVLQSLSIPGTSCINLLMGSMCGILPIYDPGHCSAAWRDPCVSSALNVVGP